MKRIVAILICIVTVFGCPFNVFAENCSDEVISESLPSTTMPCQDSATPQYQIFNNISISFYVANGRAYASYYVSSQKNGITVSVKIEKRTLGFIWVDVSDEKQEKTDKKYLSGSYSVPVSESGTYRVSVEAKSGSEKVTKTATFEYDDKILMGDANSDGVIRANDARLVLRFSAKLQKYNNNQKLICDVDRNGSVNAADARIVLKIAASLM